LTEKAFMTESLLINPLFLNSGGFHEQGPATFDAHRAENRLPWAPKRRPVMHSLSFNHALASFMAFGFYSEKPETQHLEQEPGNLGEGPTAQGSEISTLALSASCWPKTHQMESSALP
jgi:hypothetical protein